MKKRLTYTFVPEDWEITNHGQIKKILENKLKLSRHEISRLKFHGEILLAGKKVYVNQVMQIGQTLELEFPDDERQLQVTTAILPEILYEEEDFVVVNKPSGMNVHPSGDSYQMNSMGDALIQYYQKKGENFVIRTIGRLDKEASGIVIYAKNRPAAARLTLQRQEGKLKKGYIAVVGGYFDHSSGHIAMPILEKDEVDGAQRCMISQEGKPAHTFYQVLRKLTIRGKNLSLLWVMIETGRMHQIRAHLSALGHPLVGDKMYGGDMTLFNRAALHCAKVSMYSPFTNEKHTIEQDLPQDLKNLIEDKLIQQELPESMTTMIEVVKEETQSRIINQPAVLPIEQSEPDELEQSKKFVRKFALGFLATLVFLFIAQLYFANQKKALIEQEKQEIFDSLNLRLNDAEVVEYGSNFDPESLILEKNGNLQIVGTIDTKKLGVQYIIYNLVGLDKNKQPMIRSYAKKLRVVDQQFPLIELKKDTITIPAGLLFDAKENIKSVYDPIDGELKLSDTLTLGTYIISQSDVKSDEIGKYPVIIKAMDMNGNTFTSGFTVTVEKSSHLLSQHAKKQSIENDVESPVIELKAEKIYLKKGDSYQLSDNVQMVSDAVDGILSPAPVVSLGHYAIDGTINTAVLGVTTVTVRAMDMNGNVSSRNFIVEVQEKKGMFGGDNEATILQFLTEEMNLNRAAAIGILANIQRESKYNPNAGSVESYYGLIQWGGGRIENLRNFCASNHLDYTSIEGQLRYLEKELTGSYASVLEQLKSIPDSPEGAYQAGYLFSEQFERAASWAYSACGDLAKQMY